MKFDSRLIRKPYAQPRLKRAAWGFVTVAFWGVYIYLWLPLVTLMLWLLGIRTAFFELYSRQHQIEPFVLLSIPVIAALCALVLIAWAEYNRWRFAAKDRRNPHRDVSREDVADSLGATRAIAAQMAGAKVMTLHMNELAQPTSMTVMAAAG